MIINRYAKGGGLSPRIVVSVTTGATVTCSKGATTLTATSVDGKCSFNVNDYGVWTVSTNSDTQTVDVEYVQLYEVTLKYVGTLNDNDWATIRDIADASEGANYWAVGDTKQITINGKLSDGLTLSNYQTWVYIIGFDHNSDREGTGIAFQGFKTAQTGGIDICLCDSGYGNNKFSGQWFNMNDQMTSSGGWNGCNMRNNTLPIVKAALPTDLQAVIKTTTLYTDNTGGGSGALADYVTATQDTLYLLAEFEIFGAISLANKYERDYQKQYAYYVAGNSKVKYKHSSMATAANWWDRSVDTTHTDNFCQVATNGIPYRDPSSFVLGLAPAFKVGSTTISALSVGSSVYVKESGVPVEYIVVHKGNPDETMYDASCNGAWLLRKTAKMDMQWNEDDANNYPTSSINTWMNGTFYNSLNIKSIISQIKIPYSDPNAYTTVHSGSDGLSTKIFLLSCKETGASGSTFNNKMSYEGSVLDWFAASSGNRKFASTWWLRSVNNDAKYSAWFIYADGSYGLWDTTKTYSARPAFIVPLNTLVDSNNNIVV